jgi:hypothetical protein
MSKLIYSLKNNSEKDKERYVSSPKKPLFNSKLFIDLEIDKEIEDLNNNSENNTEDSDNSLEGEEINYLSNELIEELDFCDFCDIQKSKEKSVCKDEKEKDNKINNMNSNSNIINSLLSLVDDGYEFKPKNFKPIYDNNKNQNLFNKNNNNKNHMKQNMKNNNLFLFNNLNNYRDQKNDWVCTFCNNLNFSFRTKCNRCKVNKEESEKRKNIFMNIII